MNKLSLVGRIVRDIDVKTSQGGKAVARFTVATKRNTANKDGKYDSDFISCVAYQHNAEMININLGHNSSLQKNCKPLYDYISYVDRIKQNIDKKKMEKQDAINEAVDWACAHNLLEGFFREHKAMVAAVSLTEVDQELYDKCRREEGRAEGLAEGAQQKAIEDARSFYENGVSIEVIAKSLKMTEVQVKEIVSSAKSN